jgi:hypothetical protein
MINALACGVLGGPNKGSGNIIKGEVPVKGFSGVTFATAGNLIVEVGSAEELRIEVDDNLLAQYDVSVDSKMLTIKLKDGAQVEPTEEVNFYLTVEELDTLVVSGAGKVEIGSLNTDQFSVDLSGSGDVTMEGLTADSLEVTLSGSGNLEIASGYVDEQSVTISGSGMYEAEGLQSASATVEVSSSGSLTLWATQDLVVTGSGSGIVEYKGTPQLSSEGSVSVKPVSD